MAFTLSHMVIAPAVYPLLKRRIPLASLAIGAATPDLPRLFNQSGDFSHSWSGVLSIDILIGLLICLLWYGLYRPYSYALLQRQTPPSDLPTGYVANILFCAIGAIIGASTHLLWDGLTHDDFRNYAGRVVLETLIPMPGSSQPMPLYRLLQYASSLLVLPFLYFLLRPVLNRSKIKTSAGVHFVRIGVLFSALVASAELIRQFSYLKNLFFTDTYFFYGETFITFSQIFLLSLSLFAVVYRLLFFKQD